jgi:NitT/TauT family transport system ATP-binding protein
MIVSLNNISFAFDQQKIPSQQIFDKLTLEIGEENPTLILGPSGCGKTSLLRLIAGLLKAQSGSITFRTGNTIHTGVHKSFMFQEDRLLPWMSVQENILLPVKKTMPAAEARERAAYFLDLVFLGHKADFYPDRLSGGEKQRASMARAFTYDAPLLLLDEPFQSLDIPLRISLMDTLLVLLEKDKRSCIMVTHDPREALYLGKRILVLNREHINESLSSARIVLDEQAHPFFEGKKRSYVNRENHEQEERLIAALSMTY